MATPCALLGFKQEREKFVEFFEGRFVSQMTPRALLEPRFASFLAALISCKVEAEAPRDLMMTLTSSTNIPLF